MDQYPNHSGSSYSSLPSIAPQQLQHGSSLPPHTLPPLQAQQASMSMHSMYGQPLTAPHTPTASAPNTPVSASSGGYQQMGAQSGVRGYQPQGGGSAYQPAMQGYGASTSAGPQMSNSLSHAQPIAPAPRPSANRLVPLQPMGSAAPMHGMHPHMQHGMPSPYSQGPGLEETPTHVVGSQGRRGILPSAPGRPAVTATGPGATKNTVIPAKDADGKFPCPHCTKTYLHAKHLKRHLLRHTGDRPYMCVLCRDTFSRSDILKRHFQKCSIRRGNPTGASHLSHAQAHLKKPQSGGQKPGTGSPVDGDMMRSLNSQNAGSSDSNMNPFGIIVDKQASNLMPNLAGEQAAREQLSRSNSLKQMSAASTPRRTLAGPQSNGSSRASFDQTYSTDIPSTMASSINPQLAAYSMPNGHNNSSFNPNYDYSNQGNGNSNGALHGQQSEDMTSMPNGRGNLPMYGAAANGQQSNVDWAQMFQPDGN